MVKAKDMQQSVHKQVLNFFPLAHPMCAGLFLGRIGLDKNLSGQIVAREFFLAYKRKRKHISAAVYPPLCLIQFAHGNCVDKIHFNYFIIYTCWSAQLLADSCQPIPKLQPARQRACGQSVDD